VAARRCYEHAQIPWHGNVAWVGSPLVLCEASCSTMKLIQRQRPERMRHPDDVTSALFEAVVYPVFDAVGVGRWPDALPDGDNVVRGALSGVGVMDEDEGICMLRTPDIPPANLSALSRAGTRATAEIRHCLRPRSHEKRTG
jgi:hypothetical protein